MQEIKELITKDHLTVLGALIKINRMNQKMSQQALCHGLCVPSYLSKIENGEIVPSLNLVEAIFNQLDIHYHGDLNFIKQKRKEINLFFEELYFNGFHSSSSLFKQLENEEDKLIHSPLIVDYYLMKLAFYAVTDHRDKFNGSLRIVSMIENGMSREQMYRYYFYQGIDELLYGRNLRLAQTYFLQAKTYQETGQLAYFLGIVAYKKGRYYQAFEYSQEAAKTFLQEGNLIQYIGLLEFKGLLSYKTKSYDTTLEILELAIVFANKINRKDLACISHLSLAYVHLQLGLSEQARDCLIQGANLKENLDEPWNIFILVDLIDILLTKKEGENKPEIDIKNLLGKTSDSTKLFVQLFLACYFIENKSLSQIETTYQAYLNTPQINLLFDEIIFDGMCHYYTETRRYKEAFQLVQRNQL
ncbi:MAG: helix-turn-helix domain-containing protein [Turicibacter sp.]